MSLPCNRLPGGKSLLESVDMVFSKTIWDIIKPDCKNCAGNRNPDQVIGKACPRGFDITEKIGLAIERAFEASRKSLAAWRQEYPGGIMAECHFQ